MKVYNNQHLPLKERCNALYAYSLENIYSNTDTSIKYLKILLSHKEKINNKNQEADALNLIGGGSYVLGNFTEALKYYNAALELRKAIGDTGSVSDSYNNIGVVFLGMSEFPKALDAFFEALKIAEALKDKQKITGLLTNIGNVYAEKGEYKQALNYQFRALVAVKAIGDKELEADTYGGISSLYQDLNDQVKAIRFGLLSASLYKKLRNSYKLGLAYNNIGLSFLILKDYEKALSCFQKSISFRQSCNDKLGAAQTYLSLSHLYFKQNKYALSIETCNKGVPTFEEEGALVNLRDAYDGLYAAYKSLGDAKNALLYHEKYLAIKDSVANENRDKKFLQKEFQYNYDKKELALRAEQDKRNLLNEKERKEQRIVITAISCGLALVILLALVIFRSLRTNKKKNIIISAQKEEVEKQKQLVEEHQKEILDSIHYAKRIQQAHLPTQKYIEKSINRLKK